MGGNPPCPGGPCDRCGGRGCVACTYVIPWAPQLPNEQVAPTLANGKCICDIDALMRQGCKCGGK